MNERVRKKKVRRYLLHTALMIAMALTLNLFDYSGQSSVFAAENPDVEYEREENTPETPDETVTSSNVDDYVEVMSLAGEESGSITVTFYYPDGRVIDEKVYSYGDTIIEPTNIDDRNYDMKQILIGWALRDGMPGKVLDDEDILKEYYTELTRANNGELYLRYDDLFNRQLEEGHVEFEIRWDRWNIGYNFVFYDEDGTTLLFEREDTYSFFACALNTTPVKQGYEFVCWEPIVSIEDAYNRWYEAGQDDDEIIEVSYKAKYSPKSQPEPPGANPEQTPDMPGEKPDTPNETPDNDQDGNTDGYPDNPQDIPGGDSPATDLDPTKPGNDDDVDVPDNPVTPPETPDGGEEITPPETPDRGEEITPPESSDDENPEIPDGSGDTPSDNPQPDTPAGDDTPDSPAETPNSPGNGDDNNEPEDIPVLTPYPVEVPELPEDIPFIEDIEDKPATPEDDGNDSDDDPDSDNSNEDERTEEVFVFSDTNDVMPNLSAGKEGGETVSDGNVESDVPVTKAVSIQKMLPVIIGGVLTPMAVAGVIVSELPTVIFFKWTKGIIIHGILVLSGSRGVHYLYKKKDEEEAVIQEIIKGSHDINEIEEKLMSLKGKTRLPADTRMDIAYTDSKGEIITESIKADEKELFNRLHDLDGSVKVCIYSPKRKLETTLEFNLENTEK